MSAGENEGEAVIRVQGLVNEIGGRLLHDHIDLEIRRGEIFALVGGSGSGKSVLMRSIIGLNRPKAGSIEVLGHNIATGDEKQQLDLRKRWGVLFQDGALFSSHTVEENIEVPMRELMHMPEDLMHEIAAMKLSLVGLPADAGAKYPSELSGGMRKRASLARALALDPEILFLDEPTAGLDPIAADGVDRLVLELRNVLKLTTFLVTHDIDTLRSIADRIGVLVDRKLRIGTLETLRDDPNPWIQEFFGGERGRAALAP